VLKSIGFTHGQVLALVLVESGFLAGCGGVFGLGLAWFLISSGDPTGGALPIFYFPVTTWSWGWFWCWGWALPPEFFPRCRPSGCGSPRPCAVPEWS